MELFRIRPTRGDIDIAEWISDHTGPQVEQLAKILTWGADEHVVCALAAAWWLYCRGRGAQDRADGNHILLTAVAASLLPHLLKSVSDQKRPDRLTIGGHLHGVPFSGKPDDAFPSGHAMSARWRRPLPSYHSPSAIWSGRSAQAWSRRGSSCWRTGPAM